MSKRDASNRGTCGSFLLFLSLLFAWQSMVATGASFVDLHSEDIISASMPTLLSDPSIVSPLIDSGAAGEHRVKRAARDFERRVVYNKKEATKEVTITDTYRHAPSSSKQKVISKFKPKLKVMLQIDTSSDEVEKIDGQRNSPNVQNTDKNDSASVDSKEDEKPVEVDQSSAEFDFGKFDVDGFLAGSDDQQSAEVRPASHQAGSEERPFDEGPTAEVQKMISGSSEVYAEGSRQGSTGITQSSSDQTISDGSTTARKPKEYPWPASESNINPDKSKGSVGSGEITDGIFHDLIGFVKAEVGGSEESIFSTEKSVKTPKKTKSNKKGSSKIKSNSDSEESIMIKAFNGQKAETESEERKPSTKGTISRAVKSQPPSGSKASIQKKTESESDESILAALFGEEDQENKPSSTKTKARTSKASKSDILTFSKAKKKPAKAQTKSETDKRESAERKQDSEESLILKALFNGSNDQDVSEDSMHSIKKKGKTSRTKVSETERKTKNTNGRKGSKKKSKDANEGRQRRRKGEERKPPRDSKEGPSRKKKGKSESKTSKSRQKSTRQESKDYPFSFNDNSEEEMGPNKQTLGRISNSGKRSGNLQTRSRKGKISGKNGSTEDSRSNGKKSLNIREKSSSNNPSKIHQAKFKETSFESAPESGSKEVIKKPSRHLGSKGLFKLPESEELSEDTDSSRSSEEFSEIRDFSAEASSQDDEGEDETRQSRTLMKKANRSECASNNNSCEEEQDKDGSTSEEDFTRISLEDDQSSGQDSGGSRRKKNKINAAGSKSEFKKKTDKGLSEDSIEVSLSEEISSLRTSNEQAEQSSEEGSSSSKSRKSKAAGIKSKTKKGRKAEASEEDILSEESSSAEDTNRNRGQGSEEVSVEPVSSRGKVKDTGFKSKKKMKSNLSLENSQEASFSKETTSLEQLNRASEEESSKKSQVKPAGSKIKKKKSFQPSSAESEERSEETSLEQVGKTARRTKASDKKVPTDFQDSREAASFSEETSLDKLEKGKVTKNRKQNLSISPKRDDDESQESAKLRNSAETNKKPGNRKKQPDLSFSLENSSSVEDESFLESTIKKTSEDDSSDEASAETKKSRNRERWRALMGHLKKNQRAYRIKGQKTSAVDSDSMERHAVTQRGNFKFSFLPQPSAVTFPNSAGSSDKSSEETKMASPQPVNFGSSLMNLHSMLGALSGASQTSKSAEKSSEESENDPMASLRATLLKLSNPQQDSSSEEDKKTSPIFEIPGRDSSEEKQSASRPPIISQPKYGSSPSPYNLKTSSLPTTATSNSEEKPPIIAAGRPSAVKDLLTHASYFTNGDQYSRGIPIYTTDKESLAGIGWQAFSEHLKGMSKAASVSSYSDKSEPKEVPKYGGSQGAQGWHSMMNHLKPQMSKKPALFLAGNGDSDDNSKESVSGLVKPATFSTGSKASTLNSPEITDTAKNNQGSSEDSNSAENIGFSGRPVQFDQPTSTTPKPATYGSGNHGWIPITPSPLQSSYTVPYEKMPSPFASSTHFDGAEDFFAEWEPFETAFYGGSQALPKAPGAYIARGHLHPFQSSSNVEHVFSSSEEVQQVLPRQHQNFPKVQTSDVFARANNRAKVYHLNGRKSPLKTGGFAINYENGTYKFANRRFSSKNKKRRQLGCRRNRRKGKPVVQVFHV